MIKNNSSISTPCYVRKSSDRKSLISPLGCIQLTCIKSIDIISKSIPCIKKARPSQKHQLALIYTFN